MCIRDRLQDVIEWFDLSNPGLVDDCCEELYRQKIILPGDGQTQRKFVFAVADVLTATKKFYVLGGELVELRSFTSHGHETRLDPISPRDAITSVEEFVQFGVHKATKDGESRFVPKSMTAENASILLEAHQLRQRIPQIKRMLGVPIPILSEDGSIALPPRGYDPSQQVFLDLTAPEIEAVSFFNCLLYTSRGV